jgi:hypothetical protein
MEERAARVSSTTFSMGREGAVWGVPRGLLPPCMEDMMEMDSSEDKPLLRKLVII